MKHSITLIMSNVDGNNNKFWKAEMDDMFGVTVSYGRVGTKGSSSNNSFRDEDSAMRFIARKQREKERKGYKLLETVDLGDDTKINEKKIVEQAAKEQIRTKGKRTDIEDIVDKLIKLNIHSITSQTDITYDDETGLFMTPVGVVSLDTIAKARSLLEDLTVSVIENGDTTSKKVKSDLANYLMLIPQKVQSKLTVVSVLPDIESIHKQNSILDDLESSLSQIDDYRKAQAKKNKSKKVEIPELFNCELSLVEDETIINMIKGIYNNTRKKYHASNTLEINRVFEVQVDSMDSEFGSRKKTDNVMLLWHGTRAGNILSILKNGLIIPPARSGHVTGRMFGNGLYFSDQSTKSLNYSYGYWDSRQKDDTCYMFLCDVDMGESYFPKKYGSHNLPRAGYDSTFAVAGKSGVMNNEMIVYNLNQANVKYLIEFTIG